MSFTGDFIRACRGVVRCGAMATARRRLAVAVGFHTSNFEALHLSSSQLIAASYFTLPEI